MRRRADWRLAREVGKAHPPVRSERGHRHRAARPDRRDRPARPDRPDPGTVHRLGPRDPVISVATLHHVMGSCEAALILRRRAGDFVLPAEVVPNGFLPAHIAAYFPERQANMATAAAFSLPAALTGLRIPPDASPGMPVVPLWRLRSWQWRQSYPARTGSHRANSCLQSH